MTGGYFAQAFIFLVKTVSDLYLLAVLLRFLLQLVGADFYNPISQFLVKVTNPVLRHLRRFIPGYRGIDWSSIVLMILIMVVEICMISLAAYGLVPALPGLLISSLAQILLMVTYVFIIAVFIQVLLGWINPGAYNPATVILYRLTEPLLKRARRLLPPAGGLDFSPILVFVVLQLVIILPINMLADLGRAWS